MVNSNEDHVLTVGTPAKTSRLIRFRVARRPSRRAEGQAELLLVCSTGGHLWQMLALKGAWEPFSRVWVTFDKSDARSLLQDEDVVFAYGPTNRSIKNCCATSVSPGGCSRVSADRRAHNWRGCRRPVRMDRAATGRSGRLCRELHEDRPAFA